MRLPEFLYRRRQRPIMRRSSTEGKAAAAQTSPGLRLNDPLRNWFCFPSPVVRHQHPKRRDQHPLRLLLAHRPSTPALPDRPLAEAPLQADDVPDA
jgi:hypothetical protein